LELIGDDQKPIRVLPDAVGDLARRKSVEAGFGDLDAAVVMFARESDNGSIRAFALLEIILDRVEVLNGALDATRDHHGPRLATDFALGDNLFVKVVHHDFGL